MKALLRMFTQGERCIRLAGASERHVEKFGHFKEFLVGNRNAMRALAEIVMLYYSGQSFTAADIAFLYEHLLSHVRMLISALNQLTEHRYPALNQQLEEVKTRIASILHPRNTPKTGIVAARPE